MINKEGENVRLDKLLANMGYGSKRSKEIIERWRCEN